VFRSDQDQSPGGGNAICGCFVVESFYSLLGIDRTQGGARCRSLALGCFIEILRISIVTNASRCYLSIIIG
jgi:hypothetical protein